MENGGLDDEFTIGHAVDGATPALRYNFERCILLNYSTTLSTRVMRVKWLIRMRPHRSRIQPAVTF